MIFLDFSKIPQNGEFFCKFIRGEKFAQSRFAEFSKIEDKQFLSHKAQNFPNRQIARWIIAETMQSLDLSEKQRENISQVSAANTLFVSTGQQVGFLGGALYTCLKIATAINIAKKLQQQHPEIQFIPIFWLEDNDHDAKESAEVYIF
ncbi:MAG TPA: bacillithiol biosynthesis BshC, partial [Candidatus Kapabacteria bacterium]|nr:bacillithiol biosynthesis BshC [Candidatus Kapabacteria bacterium]